MAFEIFDLSKDLRIVGCFLLYDSFSIVDSEFVSHRFYEHVGFFYELPSSGYGSGYRERYGIVFLDVTLRHDSRIMLRYSVEKSFLVVNPEAFVSMEMLARDSVCESLEVSFESVVEKREDFVLALRRLQLRHPSA